MHISIFFYIFASENYALTLKSIIMRNKIIFLGTILLFAMQMYAQQSTFLYFEDKNGLKDSLEIVIGLSDEQIEQLPSFTPDEAVQVFRDSTCWVLIKSLSLWEDRKYMHTYAYKPYGGLIESDKREIFLPADHLPVTISWDKQFFIDNELTHSVMSDMVSWFDCGCSDGEIYMLLLADVDSCIIHNTFNGEFCSYVYFGNVFVKHFGIALGAANNPIEGIENIQTDTHTSIKLFRNGQIVIERNNKIYTVTGTEVK